MTQNVVWLNEVGISDVDKVGGKNASLGEMIGALGAKGVCVPGGFATTAGAFELFEWNAVSPAWTSSFPFADWVVENYILT